MADFRARQRIALHNGTEEKAFEATKPIFVALSDGTDTAAISAGGAISVDVSNATLAVTQSGTWNIATVTTLTGITNDVNIADGGNSITVDDGGGTLTVDGTVGISGTVTVSATDLDIRDLSQTQDSVRVYANTAKDGTGTAYIPLVDADGHLQVDVLSSTGSSGRTEYSDGAAQAGHVGAVVMGTDGTNLQSLSVDSSGNLQVDIVAALPAGSNSIGDIGTVTTLTGITNDVNIADGGNSITVDGTVAATQSGTWNIGTVTTLTGITNDVNIADGGNSITVDATALDIRTITKATDSIQISKDTAANSETNPIFVQMVTSATSSNEVHDYDTTASVAKDATDNHDYTVVGTTFLLKSVIASASGAMKLEVQTGPLASLATKAVFFTSAAKPMEQVFFDPPIEVPVTSTGTVRVIRRNDDNQAMDVYSTIIGSDI